ncbi:hypothetical protein [Nonomuraea terrae]|uniref:hypothetical protein n=1 Tax=Nonomuraea terrae TaxID=2530383 RepID=UPI00140560E3|nr:hypothetical protein [Nonomuraea terrae]
MLREHDTNAVAAPVALLGSVRVACGRWQLMWSIVAMMFSGVVASTCMGGTFN